MARLEHPLRCDSASNKSKTQTKETNIFPLHTTAAEDIGVSAGGSPDDLMCYLDNELNLL